MVGEYYDGDTGKTRQSYSISQLAPQKLIRSKHAEKMTIDPEKLKSIKERSTRELFEDTLEGDYEDEGPWNAVWELHKRGTFEVFQIAVEFCNSKDPLQRQRGIDVMGQFGQKYPHDGGELLYFDERVSFAIELLKDEQPRVVSSAAWALAHLEGDRAVTSLIGVRNNADLNRTGFAGGWFF